MTSHSVAIVLTDFDGFILWPDSRSLKLWVWVHSSCAVSLPAATSSVLKVPMRMCLQELPWQLIRCRSGSGDFSQVPT